MLLHFVLRSFQKFPSQSLPNRTAPADSIRQTFTATVWIQLSYVVPGATKEQIESDKDFWWAPSRAASHLLQPLTRLTFPSCACEACSSRGLVVMHRDRFCRKPELSLVNLVNRDELKVKGRVVQGRKGCEVFVTYQGAACTSVARTSFFASSQPCGGPQIAHFTNSLAPSPFHSDARFFLENSVRVRTVLLLPRCHPPLRTT